MEYKSPKDLLKGVQKVHFIGIGGSGMYPLVQILHEKGFAISGSDVLEGSIIDSERAMSIPVSIGHSAENVRGADLVVYTAALLPGNPELEEAKRLGIPAVERSVLLGYVSTLFPHAIGVSGTHGKTTTTALVTQVLYDSGRDPGAVIGGKLAAIGGYGRSGSGDEIALEACEYANTFLHLSPFISVILNIDNDHLEYFGSLANLQVAFRQFAQLAHGFVLYNLDDANTRKALEGLAAEKQLVTFGVDSEDADYKAVNLRQHKPSFWAFTPVYKGEEMQEVLLSVPGRHNVYNALAAFAACHLVGCTPAEIAKGLAAFKGTGRRFEFLGTVNGADVVDDYAHHPTELAATLDAAGKMGYRKVWAVFQPFTYSRTKMLMDDFAKVLLKADQVVMTEILGSREVNTEGVYTSQLAEKIPGSVWFPDFDGVVQYTLEHAKPGDLILTLGCGDIYKAAHRMVKSEQGKTAASIKEAAPIQTETKI